ncbi:MAG: hypothetical protein F6J93_38950 [Oscillatoria sp. SIO1A7]|nr:hypothetical protein [Oscillatoria sp. SIO1A7]
MVLPIIIGAAAAGAGAFGVKKGLEARFRNSSAKKIQSQIQAAIALTEQELKEARQTTVTTLESLGRLKLSVWHLQIGRFASLYGRLASVEFSGSAEFQDKDRLKFGSNELLEMQDRSLKAGEVIVGGAGAAGAGALAGIAGYGGAAIFGTASTGTAIGSLTGAAATNATLYNAAQKQKVYFTVQLAGVLKQLLETPILTPEGALDKTCTNALQQGVQLL